MFVKKAFGIAAVGAIAVSLLAGPAGAKTTAAPVTKHNLQSVSTGMTVGKATVQVNAKAVQARVDISKGLAPGRYQARVVNGDISRPQDAKLHSLCNLVVKADGTGNCSGKVKIKAFGPTLAVSVTPKASTDIVPSAIAFVR